MNSPFSHNPSTSVDAAAQAADQAIRGSQRAAHTALDHLADRVEGARSSVGPALDGMVSGTANLAHRGTDAVQQAARQLQDQARQWRQSTRGYIEHKPMQSVLIAMAAGAALVFLGSLLSRGRRGDR